MTWSALMICNNLWYDKWSRCMYQNATAPRLELKMWMINLSHPVFFQVFKQRCVSWRNTKLAFSFLRWIRWSSFSNFALCFTMGIALGVTNYGSSYDTTSVFDSQVDLWPGSTPPISVRSTPAKVIRAFFQWEIAASSLSTFGLCWFR